jgi:hypothetical protein
MNRIIVILDKSGSMSLTKSETIEGFNLFLREQKENYIGDENIPKFTLIMFNNYVYLENYENIMDVPNLDENRYRPDGMTSLYDAIGTAIEKYNQELNNLCLIITDGEENTSKKWNKNDVFNNIELLKTQRAWSFIYYGANQDSYNEATKIGIHNSRNYLATPQGTQSLFSQISVDIDDICSQMNTVMNTNY